jgi:hypothetical protein
LRSKLLNEPYCNCDASALSGSLRVKLVPKARTETFCKCSTAPLPGCCMFIWLEAILMDEPCCYCGPAPLPGPGCIYIWLGLKSLNEPYCIR